MTFKYSTGPMRPIFLQCENGDYIPVRLIQKICITSPKENSYLVWAYIEDMYDTCLFSASIRIEAQDWMDSLVKNINGYDQ